VSVHRSRSSGRSPTRWRTPARWRSCPTRRRPA